MRKAAVLWTFIFNLILLFWVNRVSPEQVHSFDLKQNGVALKFRVSLSKDSFDLMEEMIFDIAVENVSNRPLHASSIKSPWWIIKHENGIKYNYPGALIPLKSETLNPGATVNKSFPLEAVQFGENNLDSPIFFKYFPVGKYEVYYGPDTIPFIFHLTVNPTSRDHLRRKKFVEFCYTHSYATGFFDTTWGIPTDIHTGADLVKSVMDTNLMEKAYKFFELHKEVYGMTEPRKELIKWREERNESEILIFFRQKYKEIEFSNIVAHFSPNKRLVSVGGAYYPDITLSTIPKLSKDSAIEIVKRDLQPRSGGHKINEMDLVIYPLKRKYYLAWHTFTLQWHYFVDASTGEIIHKAWVHPPCVVE